MPLSGDDLSAGFSVFFTGLFKKAVLDLPTFLVFAVVFVLAAFCGVTPALLVAGSGVFGLALYQVRKGAGK